MRTTAPSKRGGGTELVHKMCPNQDTQKTKRGEFFFLQGFHTKARKFDRKGGNINSEKTIPFDKA